MAWLEQRANGHYHIGFRYDGFKFKKALRTRDVRTAKASLHRVDENIRLVESGRLVIPDDADVGSFLLSDGKLNGAKPGNPRQKLRTLQHYIKAFLASIPDGGLEANTLKGMDTHFKHLRRILGMYFVLTDLRLEDLQNAVLSQQRF